MAKAVKKATRSKAKKRWFPIVGPRSFDNVPLGESHVESAERLIGKSITVNLMHLTNDMRNQGIEIRFDIVKVQDGKGIAAVGGYEVLPSHLKRVVRRGRSKVADSFIVRVGKERLVRIKPMVFTANRASKGAQRAIRLAMREKIKEVLAETTFERLIQELIGFKLQRTLKDVAGKLHPIKSVEIKACRLLPSDVEVREEDGELVIIEEEGAEPSAAEDAAEESDGDEPAAEESDGDEPAEESEDAAEDASDEEAEKPSAAEDAAEESDGDEPAAEESDEDEPVEESSEESSDAEPSEKKA